MNRRFLVSIIICIVIYVVSTPIINKFNYKIIEVICPNDRVLLMENKLKVIELDILNLKSEISELKKKGN